MPTYHFHVQKDELHADEDGTEFPDVQTAWQQSVRALGEFLVEMDSGIPGARTVEMIVTDKAARNCFDGPLHPG